MGSVIFGATTDEQLDVVIKGLDVDLNDGLERVFKRKKIDRYEKKELAFHQRVREHFLNLAKEEPERFCCINTSIQSLSKTHQNILAVALQQVAKTKVPNHML